MPTKHAVVFDFDGTLTPRFHISLFNVVEKGVLPSKYLQEAEYVRNKYIYKAMRGTLTRQEELTWLKENINIFVEAGVTIKQVEKALKHVKFRDNAQECLAWLKGEGVPIAVVSYGIYQFIEVVLKNNHAQPLIDSIYATKLDVDQKTGKIIGFHADTVVLPTQKGDASLHFADLMNIDKSKILAVGDSQIDSRLGFLKENRFGIAEDHDQLRRIENVMGKSVITHDFAPVIEWLYDKIANKKSPA